MKASQGEWIKFIASDDILLPKAIEKNVSSLSQNPKAKIIISNLIHFGSSINKQRAYRTFNQMSFAITEQLHKEVLSLPLSAVMSEKEMVKVAYIYINKIRLNEFSKKSL